jgi:putative sugar O-methyltransferase
VTLEQPSRFWEELGASHRRQLDEHGFASVKRRQALRYFNWRWQLGALRRSEQFRFLLTHTSPRQWLAAASAPTDLGDAAWAGVPWARSDRWLYAFAVRLLWEYARTRDSLGVLDLPEPTLGGPLPVQWRERLISQDLANSALEAEAIGRALAGRKPTNILEVGAGYGRTAYTLLNLYPEARYTIVDIEPALSISRWYLSQLFPADRLRFLTPEQAQAEGGFDLVVSVSSLHEMTREQIGGYIGLFDRVAAGGVVYLKQWQEWHNPADDVTVRFTEYPIPAHWRKLFEEAAPVQTRFQQAAWALPSR